MKKQRIIALMLACSMIFGQNVWAADAQGLEEEMVSQQSEQAEVQKVTAELADYVWLPFLQEENAGVWSVDIEKNGQMIAEESYSYECYETQLKVYIRDCWAEQGDVLTIYAKDYSGNIIQVYDVTIKYKDIAMFEGKKGTINLMCAEILMKMERLP